METTTMETTTMETAKKVLATNEFEIKKENITTDIFPILSEFTQKRNNKGKTYSYVAICSDYQNSKNHKREFFNVGDYMSEKSYNLNTEFINNLKVNQILEVKINIKLSAKYSNVSETYLVVSDNTPESITFKVFESSFKAFKSVTKD